MKKLFVISLLVTLFITTGCSSILPAPEPTPDIDATVAAVAAQMISETQTAMPTFTALPTYTDVPTATVMPTEVVLSPVPTATETPFDVPTALPCYGPWSQGDISKENDGFIRIENHSSWPKIIVHMDGNTWKKSFPVYYCWTMGEKAVVLDNIKFGHYNLRIEVPGITTIWGSFQINNTDKTTFEIYDRSYKVYGP